MKLIVGLGNPGKKYENTRHNAGFMVLDNLHETLKEYHINYWELSKKFNGLISGASYKGEKIILLKPLTYMNASGQSVQLVARYYKISPSEIIVVHDDKDIDLGEIKIQKERNSAGHNGVQSIIDCIGTNNFTRVRIGIMTKNKEIKDTSKFVLGRFGFFEKKNLKNTVSKATDEILNLLK